MLSESAKPPFEVRAPFYRCEIVPLPPRGSVQNRGSPLNSHISDNVAERSKAPRSGRGLVRGVGSNPTVVNLLTLRVQPYPIY